MDKNTIIGIVLIGLILVGYSIFNKPSEEELKRIKAKQDSIALVNQKIKEQQKIDSLNKITAIKTDSTKKNRFLVCWNFCYLKSRFIKNRFNKSSYCKSWFVFGSYRKRKQNIYSRKQKNKNKICI